MKLKNEKKIIIIGAGPSGLGAACSLLQSPRVGFDVFEAGERVGGLSASSIDDVGFTWDIGGHVLFSHFEYFDHLVEQVLGGQYYEHQRECWVRILDTWVPYPFQNNIRYLPEAVQDFCLDGLKRISGKPESSKNFKQWMNNIFGEGIVRYFMEPYNFKVWATPAELMSKDWVAERVSVVDLDRIKRNISKKIDDVSWGPNNTFKFPQSGGTGAIWEGVARQFEDKIKFNHELSAVDLKMRRLRFRNGSACGYDYLISTIPINQLIERCIDVPEFVRAAASKLVHNSVFVVGIGLESPRSDSRCWMYFPEENCPFYRVTNFHNYSQNNVPSGCVDKYSAFVCETSYSLYKPVNKETIVEETIAGLINVGMMKEAEREKIVSRYLVEVPYAYPIPTTDRDELLAVIQPFLESHDVFSRGRFGAWKYEVGNMDHSFMQGVEIASRLLTGNREKILYGGSLLSG